MYKVKDLVIRDLAPVSAGAITEVVDLAMRDGLVATWLQPDTVARHRGSTDYFAIFVEHILRCGDVYTTAEGGTGRLTGAALWLPMTTELPALLDYEHRIKEIAGDAYDRVCELDAALDAEHPAGDHHYLAYLAVRPDQQGRGLGSTLLRRHHRRLDAAGLPAYLEANDPRNRDLYLRHGYQVRSVIELPDGPPLWCMWRPPME
ncbi:GNAT family N-acetyltransferase [Actinoplanes sp. CA-142083]|uniref:GNAT family N-acetyltransferase n=1 Tax=Actinoplanes sp. CA-142083 TaxID=3239903 RepID=UPI003D932D40